MKKIVLILTILALSCSTIAVAQENIYVGQSCTSIMVGKNASSDGSVITSHTCDGRYRTWMTIEPAADHRAGEMHKVLRGTMMTTHRDDTTGVKVMGEIPQVAHTYAYLNTAYPCMNEHKLAMGEATFGGPDTLMNEKGMFTVEELQRVALQRCKTAREAIKLIGELIEKYGYGDAGECITIADPKEVWQMEMIGAGHDQIGGVWVAQRVPDDQVAVSANIPRIGRLQRHNPDYFMCSDNVESVAKKYGLWNGKEEFKFWKAYNCDYAKGKNFSSREYFILNALAPSWNLTMEMDELPFSVKPDKGVDIRDVIELFRATYEGTDLDMCKNLKAPVKRRDKDGKIVEEIATSPIANPWMSGSMVSLVNNLKPGTVEFQRTVSVAWCAYSHVITLYDDLPDALGGICWMSVDNPAQSPRVPIFCGNTRLPKAYGVCGQKEYNEDAIVWKYRKANKLATVAWQRTKDLMDKSFHEELERAFKELPNSPEAETLNAYTLKVYDETSAKWASLEAKLWSFFGLGF